MNKEIKQQIFSQYPEVKLAFDDIGKKDEREFWKRFFRSYILEDQRRLDDGFSLPSPLF